MYAKIAITAAILLATLLGYAAILPDTFTVQRTTSIKASPEKIFAYINDFHYWTFWSPWEKMDPKMKKTYSGSGRGIGMIYEWEGNDKVGAGRMEITNSSRPNFISINLDLIRPYKSHNITEFTLSDKGGLTEITWAMTGHATYLTRLTRIFINLDNVVGQNFEAGLANLKAVAEKQTAGDRG